MLRTSIHPPASSSRIYRQSDECGMPYFFAALLGKRNSRRGPASIAIHRKQYRAPGESR